MGRRGRDIVTWGRKDEDKERRGAFKREIGE
jgi:hypothetical protein